MKKTIILLLILTAGFILRSHHLDFPSLGYHNMKENEYLSIAQEMERTGDFLKKRVYFHDAFDEKASLKADSQPALVSYQVILAWRILGENIWGSRLINIFFGLLSILSVYLISRILFKDDNLSLFSALLLAIMPLAVFFSRNIQPESPALFFMLLGSLFYLKFAESLNGYSLLAGGFFFVIAWLYKFSFLAGAIPLLFCLPYGVLLKDKKKAVSSILLFVLPYLLIPAAILYLKHIGQWIFNFNFKPFEIFTPLYWKNYANIIFWYVRAENFTFFFSLLAACGLILAFFRLKGLLNRYLIGCIFGLVFFAALYPDALFENNFSLMPFLGMVCVSCAYTVSFLSQEIKKAYKKEARTAVFALVVLVSLPSVFQSLSKMYGTLFLGQDACGESLKEFSAPNERIFLFTYAQGNAIARYAQRYVYKPADLKDFKEKEEKFKIRLVCIYPGELLEGLRRDKELFDHLQENYHIKEIGLFDQANRLGYLILEKGKPKDKKILEALESVTGVVQPRAVYKIQGRYVFYYSVRPTEQNAK